MLKVFPSAVFFLTCTKSYAYKNIYSKAKKIAGNFLKTWNLINFNFCTISQELFKKKIKIVSETKSIKNCDYFLWLFNFHF